MPGNDTLNVPARIGPSTRYTPTAAGAVSRPVVDRLGETISVKDFDATGDGRVLTGGFVAAGQAVLNMTAGGVDVFTDADVGRLVAIPGGGPGGVGFYTTITSIFSARIAILADAASTELGGITVTIGTDDRAGILDAIDAAEDAGGGEVFFPDGIYMLSGGLEVPGGVTLRGTGQESAVLAGSGFALVTLSGERPGLADLRIDDPAGLAATVGLTLGVAGSPDDPANHYALRHVTITGGGHLVYPLFGAMHVGKGIRTVCALKGSIEDLYVDGWDKGGSLESTATYYSNANHFVSSKFRENVIGIDVPGNLDDVYLTGCTIEGNGTGLQAVNGQIVVTACHFENVWGAKIDVSLLAGNATLQSRGSQYFASTVALGKDIVVAASNTGRHTSHGDRVWTSIEHNGSGNFLVTAPAEDVTYTGTGPLTEETALGLTSRNITTYTFSGLTTIDFGAEAKATKLTLNGAGTQELIWSQGATEKWKQYHIDDDTALYLRDLVNSRMQVTHTPGASATLSLADFNCGVTISGPTTLAGAQTYADNATAVGAGWPSGTVYKTVTGELRIVV